MKDPFSVRIDANTGNEAEEWQFNEIQAGITELETQQAIPHERVAKWLATWGTSKELDAPL